MPTAQQIADHVLITARNAVDDIASFLLSDSVAEDDDMPGAELVLGEGMSVSADPLDRATWERTAAVSLLIGGRCVVPKDDDDDDDPDQTDPGPGYALLEGGELDGALEVADALLRDAASSDEDDWNYGNLIHHAHILRGKVFLQRRDLPGAAAELVAAGATPGSPQLDSFGPDFTLAWALLLANEDAAILTYLHAVARFWSPIGTSGL